MDEQGNQMADKETVGEDGTGSFGLHGPGPYQEPPVWMRTSEEINFDETDAVTVETKAVERTDFMQASDGATNISAVVNDDNAVVTGDHVMTVEPTMSDDHDHRDDDDDEDDWKPNDHVELATLACLLNCVTGIVALSYSLRAKESWRKGDREGAKRNALTAFLCSIFTLVIFVIVVFIIVWHTARTGPTRSESG